MSGRFFEHRQVSAASGRSGSPFMAFSGVSSIATSIPRFPSFRPAAHPSRD
jgi:hypothetical protein